MSLELLFSSYSVNWPHNVYYSSPGHDDTHGSTRGIRIDRRLIIFPSRFWSIHYKHTWLNLKSERHRQGKQIVESVK